MVRDITLLGGFSLSRKIVFRVSKINKEERNYNFFVL